ncbi:MAG: hypothetical protein GX357_06940 [Firmicutes bacterium]|nr:hypothetical protein [Bacillota bacterium]
MDYFLLSAGLILTLAAALLLIFGQKNSFAGVLQEKINRPVQHDIIALAGLLETLKVSLTEMDEKIQMLQYLLNQQKKQQEIIDLRLQQLEELLQLQPQAETTGPTRWGNEKKLNNRRQQVYQLFDQGLSVPEVASRLQLGRGEVELILGWRKAKA